MALPLYADDVLPEVREAIRIADKYLPHAPYKKRAELAKEIVNAIGHYSAIVAHEVLEKVLSGLADPAITKSESTPLTCNHDGVNSENLPDSKA